MSNKTTKKDLFNAIIEGYDLTTEHKDFILHEIELLNKRSERKSDKPTKKQEANAVLKEAIAAVLAEGTPKTATDIANAVEGVTSPQKASALLKQMKDAGTVESFVEKRVTYFKMA